MGDDMNNAAADFLPIELFTNHIRDISPSDNTFINYASDLRQVEEYLALFDAVANEVNGGVA